MPRHEVKFEVRECARMQAVRERAGLSRRYVARRLRWSEDRLADFERGTAIPSVEEAASLSQLYQDHWDNAARRRSRNAFVASRIGADERITHAGAAR
jgi:transcriptional regulator with XRE-family HTH domain